MIFNWSRTVRFIRKKYADCRRFSVLISYIYFCTFFESFWFEFIPGNDGNSSCFITNICICSFCLVMFFYALSNHTVNQHIMRSFDLHARWSFLCTYYFHTSCLLFLLCYDGNCCCGPPWKHEWSMQQKGRNDSFWYSISPIQCHKAGCGLKCLVLYYSFETNSTRATMKLLQSTDSWYTYFFRSFVGCC